ncbi:MAG: F0F1 ATP synthase subunit A [Spirochaetaceae bacterium]|jgi:F-type H+-transporting ATPase subunit a|nr:F0F1 ATP synthase subunit A [Spirochaetaceae bacterium]
MDIKGSLEEFKIIFSIPIFRDKPLYILGQEIRSIDINETVLISWVVMAILIIASLVLTRRFKEVPRGPQVILEAMVEFLNRFSKDHFGRRAKTYGPFIGTIFLFLLLANIIPVLSPVGAFGHEPLFSIRPPTRDINLTAAMAILAILVVLVSGLRARGLRGWCKNLLQPVPMMLPFNLLEYIIRPTSMCLRLFGNILGGLIIMLLIEGVVPIALPPILSLYFDFLDGLIQAMVFTFLTTLFIAEAVEVE